MPDNHDTFPILQPNFLLLHKETFSLCCFDMPGCLVAVVEKKKKTPTAQTGVWFLFPRQTHHSQMQIACGDHRLGKIIVYLEMLALGQSTGLEMKCMFERKWYNSEGVIAVMIDPKPDIFHKWKLAFRAEKNQEWVCQSVKQI